jgi:hypothetical protein
MRQAARTCKPDQTPSKRCWLLGCGRMSGRSERSFSHAANLHRHVCIDMGTAGTDMSRHELHAMTLIIVVIRHFQLGMLSAAAY